MATPYEMRFNYIHFARDYLRDQYQAQIERITLSYPNIDDPAMKEDLSKLRFPTREDIFELAEQIKDFTDKK